MSTIIQSEKRINKSEKSAYSTFQKDKYLARAVINNALDILKKFSELERRVQGLGPQQGLQQPFMATVKPDESDVIGYIYEINTVLEKEENLTTSDGKPTNNIVIALECVQRDLG